MGETTTEVRAEIEQTRARMSGAIAELERKVDVTQKVRDHPWSAVGVAFGAGIALSASRADVRAAKVTADATKETGSKIGAALDGVVAALMVGVAEAFQSRIDGAVKEVVSSIRGTTSARSINTSDRAVDVPIRAD
jgi:outer membrane receptor protein involved in Fe transport